ncbi:MAG TPA: hypothetical protein DCY88_11290 [Cyanobacteria bacterium UBA11372]|nr:hypothetical protein [Cyanobacteria bacterium UBA11372]
MSEQAYSWKRFWCPRSGSINLADGGYLGDPSSEWGQYYNPDLVSLEAIANIPCLVLLGEPGIGKSQEMENLKKYTEETIEQADKILELNLRSCTSLIDDLFKDETFLAWIDSTNNLYLFLDSLDEGLLGVPNLATQLVDNFKKTKYRERLNRLYLRIACRTAVFPEILEKGLEELWGKNSVEIYELAPLRRVDVMEAAKAEGFSPDDFLKEVGQKNIVPLAIKPVTLGFLLNSYRRHNGQFPSNQRLYELYLEGCKLLCEEVNSSRRSSNRKGNLEIDQRLIVAARIAAITILANRFAVWTGIERGDVPDEDMILQKLCHGYENANGRQFEITRAVIEEVLDTGLFSSRGLHRMGWAHQTYAEFLAAWYLKQHQLSLSQILDLIIHPDRRVVPQLQETTAWLASIIPEVFQEIVKTDPDVLLQSDIATAEDTDKAKLVESLLKLRNEEKLAYSWQRYTNLNHPGLAEQLESYIRDSWKNQWSRLSAINIARYCDVKAVQDSLADIALDPTQLYIVRTNAADTVCVIGDEKTKARLKRLALGEAGDDPYDDLKGYGLRAVWPKHITAEDLLNSLSQPKQRGDIPRMGGVYQNFIAKEFAKHLPLPDLPVALKWLEKLPIRYNLHYPFIQLADSVMMKAWQNLEEPGVLEAFANIAMFKLKRHEGILSDRTPQIYTINSFDNPRDPEVESSWHDSDEKRRLLIKTIISLLSDSENDLLWLTPTVCSKDILWVIENVTSAESDRTANIWVKLLRKALTWYNLYWKYPKHINAILEARNISLAMRSEFEIKIELGSEKAKHAEADYLQYQNCLKPPEPEPLLEPQPKQRVLEVLEIIEAGQPQLWWQVCMAMTLIPTSTHCHFSDEPDLTQLPGWQEAEADPKKRITKTAKVYLEAVQLETNTLLDIDNFSIDAFAGYQALYLLLKQEPEFIPTIPNYIWSKWIPVIIKYTSFCLQDRAEKDEFCQKITIIAYHSNPVQFIETLIVLMTRMNYQPRTGYSNDVYRCTKNLLNEPIVKPILRKVKDEDLNAGMLEILLADFSSHEIDEAKTFALSFVSTPIPKHGEARAKAVVAARMLVLHADNSNWSTIWSAIQQDSEFGREVLESVAFQVTQQQGQIEQQLKEEYLADLYIFLAQHYPDIEEREHESKELRGVTPRFTKRDETADARNWKNLIPYRLQQRGTPEACEALQKMIYELPEHKEKLQQRLLEAEILARRKTWKSPHPEEILQIASNQDKRLVQDGHQLLNVLLESLKRLELELQGETPAVRDLWDKVGDNKFKPVDENAFSDYVKRFLDRDVKSRGIVANREVELRRNYGGSPGERTDIHVDAVVKKQNGELYDCITVIIEVKGCWHSDLNSAMKEQLVERYLQDNSSKYGLYLVGWFNCNQWDDKDSRKGKAPKISIDQAREQFDRQAEQLSSPPNVVRAYVLNTALR